MQFVQKSNNVAKVELILESGEKRIGNVITLNEDITVIQVYEGTDGLDTTEVKTILQY